MIVRIAAATVLAAGMAGHAAAQSPYGDTDLAYRGGVVFDDDLVPGEPVNQPYQPRTGASVAEDEFDGPRAVRRPSPNLIGSDGRIEPRVRPANRNPRIRN